MKSGNANDVIYKEVVVVGNGPSGIAMSYMLSGNLPFLTSAFHPDEMLSMRLAPVVNKCLIKQDLGHLATGLEGRSTNPVSLLLDSLVHPCADIGLEMAPLVEFRKVGVEIDHVVLGKGPPGGSWHRMDPYILTLSLGSWMALPGLPFHSRDSGENRAFACNVANYYVNYVTEMELSKSFVNNVTVATVEPASETLYESDGFDTISAISTISIDDIPTKVEDKKHNCRLRGAFSYFLSRGNRKRCCKRPREGLCQGHSPDRKIRSLSICDDSSDRSRSVEETTRVPFRISYKPVCDPVKQSNWLVEAHNVESGETTVYYCKYLVLANGGNDLPNRLEFATNMPDPDWLFHDLRTLELRLDQYLKGEGDIIDPVVVVGAGLSAADAVIAARGRNVPVIHVFRNKSADLSKQLPENMYPEYHKVHQMMQDGGSTYPYYSAYPEFTLDDLQDDHTVILTSLSGERLKVRCSFAVVLIGSRPDLAFLPPDLNLAVKKDAPIDCKTNTLDIDKVTHCVNGFDNLFAVGPLTGDNFVRFIPGGALAVISELYKRSDYYICSSD